LPWSPRQVPSRLSHLFDNVRFFLEIDGGHLRRHPPSASASAIGRQSGTALANETVFLAYSNLKMALDRRLRASNRLFHRTLIQLISHKRLEILMPDNGSGKGKATLKRSFRITTSRVVGPSKFHPDRCFNLPTTPILRGLPQGVGSSWERRKSSAFDERGGLFRAKNLRGIGSNRKFSRLGKTTGRHPVDHPHWHHLNLGRPPGFKKYPLAGVNGFASGVIRLRKSTQV
jgi:hypothetical protein